MIDHIFYISLILLIGWFVYNMVCKKIAKWHIKQTWCKSNCKIFKLCEMRKGGINKKPIWCNYYNDINRLNKLEKERSIYHEQ